MAQVINTNVFSLNAQRSLNNSQGALQTALQRLSSGLRINSAKDDAAGLAIADRFTAQIRGMNQGVRNASDAISLSQTAEGALGEISSNLQRIRELAIQAVNATNTQADRTSLNQEVTQLKAEIIRATSTEFNGVQVIGNSAQSFAFQVGPNAGNTITISTQNVSTITGAVSFQGAAISDITSASDMITIVDSYLDAINASRATLGAIQNRFESVIRIGQNSSENLSASRSRILDADFASETAALTRAQILQQTGTAMLAQANSVPQSVLSLLK